MRPPERFPPDDPREWRGLARSNLVLATNRAPDVFLKDLCFEARQVSEKALKAGTRNPGIVRPVADREHEEAVEIAEAVVRWAGERL